MHLSATRKKPSTIWGVLARVHEGAQVLEGRQAMRAFVNGYRDNDLLTYASAIAFQVLFALVPLTLFMLGLLGFFHLEDVWRADIAPQLRPEVSPAAFTLLDSTVTKVLSGHHLFWVTLGAPIAVWEISGAMRAVMQVFNRIYAVSEETRSFARRMLVSLGLAAAAGALVISALAVSHFGPRLVGVVFGHGLVVGIVFFIARWAIVIALLLFLVGLLVRLAPDCRRPLEWVSFGALVVVLSWLAMSLAFGWYLSSIADYGSVFGSLATLIVLMEYLYLSSIVFLTGIQADSLVRHAIAPEVTIAAPGPAVAVTEDSRTEAGGRSANGTGERPVLLDAAGKPIRPR